MFNKERFLPCFVKIGTNNPTSKEKEEIRTEMEIKDYIVLPVLNLFKNNLFIGLTIKVKIKEMNI